MWEPSIAASLKSRSAVAITVHINAAWGGVDEWGEAEEHGGQGELHGIMVLDGGRMTLVWRNDVFF